MMGESHSDDGRGVGGGTSHQGQNYKEWQDSTPSENPESCSPDGRQSPHPPPSSVESNAITVNPDVFAGPVFILCLAAWHFFWTTWSNNNLISGGTDELSVPFLPGAWFFYSYALVAICTWAAADERPISALALVIFFGLGILCDYIFFGIHIPHAIRWLSTNSDSTYIALYRNLWRFSFGAAIINHITKYLTFMVGILAFRIRGGPAVLRPGNKYSSIE